MSNRLFSIIFFCLLLSLTGCDKFQPSNTVILDLDAIAKATGQADIIKQQIEQANKELNSQLSIISNKLNDQLSTEKRKMGKKPSKDELRQQEQLTLQANQKMQQAKMLASQKSQQYRAALIQKLRLTIKPIAEKIASNRGADIVVTASNSTIWFNAKIDITDEVIAEMRAQASTQTSTQVSEPMKQPQSKDTPTTESEK